MTEQDFGMIIPSGRRIESISEEKDWAYNTDYYYVKIGKVRDFYKPALWRFIARIYFVVESLKPV